MKTTEVDFHFPVLGFTTDKDVWGLPDMERLTTCGSLTLKNDMQLGMELVDAAGRRWLVRSVRRLGRTGSWLRVLLTAKPQSRIEHELEPLEPLSLKETQARVCASMEAHPDFWCEEADVDTEMPRRLAEVRATKTIAGIHEVLGLDGFNQY